MKSNPTRIAPSSRDKRTTRSLTSHWKKIIFSFLFAFGLASTGFAQVSVTATAGTIGPTNYTTLGGAFNAINAGTHQGTITVAITADTNEGATTAVLNASGSGSASYATISIQPSGGAARTITGAAAGGGAMIDFNGADNVTIDGLNTGGNSLTISNTTVSASSGTSTIQFRTDATNNTITRCSVLGSATMAAGTNGGNIFFASGAVTTGNDNNTISNCNIGPAGANLPTKGIYFSGSSNTDPGTANSGIIINNNNIFDYFSTTVSTAGIDLNSGTVGTTVSNNKFYQTATRTMTTTSLTHSAIRISNTSGNAYQITGNTIGFAAANGTGTYTVVATATSPIIPINLSVGSTTATSVQNNTIAGMAISGASSGTSSSAAFRGIYVAAGLTTIGNVTGNTIGSQSATGSITYTSSSSSASDVIGMFNFGSDNWTTNNNTVGGITASNSSTGAANIYGIRANTTSSVTWTCNNNNVGGAVANSINSTSTATGTIVNGILNSSPIGTFTGNTIRNMTVAGGTGTTTIASMAGIVMSNSGNNTLGQNSIFILSNSNTSAATVVTGIQFSGSGTTNIVERNLIYGLTSATTSTAAEINGIRVGAGTTTYRNNMIAIGAGIANAIGTGTTAGISGINEPLVGTDNFFHNSVYIGGSPTAGVGPSFAFNSTQTTNTRSFRDNIFFNARSNSGATGKNYIVRVGGTAANPTGLTINNNVYFANGTGAVFGFFNSLDVADLSAWKTAVGQDAASFSSNPQYQDPTNATPDLHINPSVSTVVEANGADVGVVNDFDGQTRSGLTPVDIGADAGNFTGVDLTAPAISYTPLGNTTSTANRTLASTITDATGVPTSGTGLPRVYYRKGTSGAFASTQASSGGGSAYTFTIDYSLVTGGTVAVGDTIQYYVAAQDTASTPNVTTNPSAGASGFTANPPAASTPPTTPNSYIIQASISGTFTVGGGGNYATLTAAAADLNSKVLTGPVVFNLTDASYNRPNTPDATETYPITINANSGSSASFTVTIKPASGNTVTMSASSASSMFKLNGASWIIIDGSNNGSSSRDLTITNTNTASATAAIWVASTGTGAGSTNCTIKNCNISTGVSTTSANYGVAVSGSTIGASGADNDSNTIQNNVITGATIGIYAIGTASVSSGGLDSLAITGNSVDYNATLASIGIEVGNALNSSVSQNTVSEQTSAIQAPTGISLETGFVSSSVTRNTVTKALTTNTGGYGGRGMTVGTGTATSALQISNNVIYGVNGSDFSSFPNSSSMGICIGTIGNTSTLTTTAGGVNLYFNSVRMTGNIGSNSTAAITTALYVGTGASALDLRDNVFANTQTGTSTTQKNYAIYSAATSAAFTTINYNDYFVSNSFNAASAIPGFIGSDRTNLAGIQTGFGQNVNSIVADPLFNSSTNLQPQTGSPVLDTGVSLSGTVTPYVDFTGATRVDPPSMGAYETASDTSPPAISYTPLGNTTSTSNRTLASTITDATGVPTSGTGLPRVYYRKGTSGAFASTQASSGGGSSYTFTIDYSLVTGGSVAVGDTIQYYVAAQDTASTPNVTTNPSTGASGFTANPPAASTPPTTPNSYQIQGTISGSFNVGTGQTYATLTAAVADLNSKILTGPVTLLLKDAVNQTILNSPDNTGEVFPIILNANAGSTATNKITIKPDAGVVASITGSATTLIKINGASYVTIDGSNSGGTDRSLTISDTSTATGTGPLTIASLGVGAGATNVTIKNCIIKGGSIGTTSIFTFGIFVGDTSGAAAGADNDNLTIQNNQIASCRTGMQAVGAAGGIDDNMVISGNLFGDNVLANSIGRIGLLVSTANNATISGNTIKNIFLSADTSSTIAMSLSTLTSSSVSQNTITGIQAAGASGVTAAGLVASTASTGVTITQNTIDGVTVTTTSDPVGLSIGSGFVSSSITRNNITNITYTGTGGYGGRGMDIGTGSASSALTFSNNTISNIKGDGWSSFASDSIAGIRITGTTGGLNFYFNSVNLGSGSFAGNSSGTLSAAFYCASTATALDLRDNVFTTNLNNTVASTAKTYAIYSEAANTAFTNINYNDYFGGGTQGVAGFLTSARTDLAGIQAGFGQNANSIVSDPLLNSATNLQPQLGSPVLDTGVSLTAQVSPYVDFTGATRVDPPSMGAYENGSDNASPTISYTPLASTTSTTNRTLSSTITDATGVPTSGTGLPVLYYRKNGTGSFIPSQASYGGGSSYSFLIDHSSVGGVVVGDSIQYYVVAQDTASPINVGSNPSTGASGFTANPPAASTPPTTPNSYTILASISGSKNIPGDYPTLTAAVAALNSSVITGPVVFNLVDSSFSRPGSPDTTGETFPITINANSGSSSTNTVTIKPASGQTVTMTGSSSAAAVIIVNGADYVIVDGSNNGTSSRDLTITNGSTSTASAVIWLQSNGADGATNNVVENVNVVGSGNTQTLFGVGSGGSTISITSAGNGNNGNLIANCNISRTQYGIYSGGASASNKNTGNAIYYNLINAASPDNVAIGGILVNFESGIVIQSNTIAHINSGTTPAFGITLGLRPSNTFTNFTGSEVSGAYVEENVIDDIVRNGDGTSFGIGVASVSSAFDANRVSNNMISRVRATSATPSDFAAGILLGGGSSGAAHVIHNSVSMTGAGATTAPTFGVVVGGSNPSVLLIDNIFYNTQTTTTGKTYAIGLTYGSPYTNLNSDYNDFFSSGTNANFAVTGGLTGTARTSLSAWRTETGTDANSISADPQFKSTSDLHIGRTTPATLSPVENVGSLILGVDFDNDFRANPPDIGADEVMTLQFSAISYSAAEGDGTATIGVTRTNGANGAASVNYTTTDGSASGGASCSGTTDYVTSTGTLNFPAGATFRSFTIPICNDSLYEANETVNIALSSISGDATAGDPQAAVLTITDNDTAPTLSINSVSVNEGAGTADFTVTQSAPSGRTTTFRYDTADGTAFAPGDYTAVVNGIGTIPAGSTTTTVSIPINNDSVYEGDETFTVTLSNQTFGANRVNSPNAPPTVGTATIQDNDTAPTVQFSSATYSVNENVPMVTVTITKSGATELNATVTYNTSDGSATQPADYTATAGSVTFLPNQTTKTFDVLINDDGTFEGNEDFTVVLSSPSGATLGTPSSATVTIVDDDALPLVQFSAANYNVNEGAGTVTVTVTKTGTTALPSTVNYATSDGSATQPADYTQTSGMLTFLPNDTSKTFTVPISQDTVYEGNETFNVTLSTPVGASLGSPNPATVTIIEDDAAPVFTINDVSHNEGHASQTSYAFTVTKTGSTAVNATVDYATADGTATAPGDYTAIPTTGLTFLPNETTKTVTVMVNGDTTYENNEDFTVELSNASSATISDASGTGTIVNDDAAPTFTINDVSHNEGNASTTDYTFTVTKTGATEVNAMVDYGTANGSAVAPGDYTAIPITTLTFLPNETTKQITVLVNGDTTYETDETFKVQLTNPVNGGFGVFRLGRNAPTAVQPFGTGTIVNDDAAPAFSINDVSHMEGNASTTMYTFTVTKTGATALSSSVTYETVNGTAAAPGDFTAIAPTVLSFGPTDTTMTVTVLVNGDTTPEPNETFTVHLSNATAGATISDADGLGTITNDDGQPPIVYVDDNWVGTTPGTDPDGAGPATSFGFDAFDTVEGGVNGVAPNGTVIVYAGNYVLATNVAVNKSVSIQGPNIGNSPNNAGNQLQVRGPEAVVNGNAGAFNGSSGKYFNVTAGATSLTISGFKFTNFDGTVIAEAGGAALTSVDLHQNIFDTNNGSLMYKFNLATATAVSFTDNKVANQSMTGINTALLFMGNLTNSHFDNNDVNSVASRELINLYDSLTNTTISHNTLTNTAGLALLAANQNLVTFDANTITSTATAAGVAPIYVSTNDGRTVTNLAITNNIITTVTGGGIGIRLSTDTATAASITGVTISGNTISGTSAYGLDLDTFANTGTGTISNVNVQNNQFTNNAFGPMLAYARPTSGTNVVSNLTLQGNTYMENAAIFGASFVQIDLRNVSGTNTIDGNTYTLSGVLPPATTSLQAIGIRGNKTGTFNITNNNLNGGGVLHNGAATVFQSGIRIFSNDATTGALPATAVINAQNNFIRGWEDGVVVRDGVAAAYGGLPSGMIVKFNYGDLSGNSLKTIRSGTGELVDASTNWWGTVSETAVAGLTSGGVDFTPYYNSGTDTNIAAGFQGDLSFLHVTTLGAQTNGGRPQEGVFTLNSGGTLQIHAGSYTGQLDTTPKAVIVSPGASPGQVSIGTYLLLDSDDTVLIEINGTNAATDYDNFVVNGGGVNLDGATLTLSGTYNPQIGDTFTIVNKTTVGPVSGTFAGLPEGATVTFNGVPMRISYVGGTGNDVTLSVVTYTVTYDANGGTGSQTDPNSPYLAGSTVTVLGAGTITRTGYTFSGWNTAANGSGTSYSPGATFNINANTTLFAQWTINTYTVTYDGNNNTGGTAPVDPNSPYNYNSTVTVLSPGSLTKTGYTFSGWNTAANGSGTSYSPGATFTMPAANVILYAQWTINTYTVTYDGNTNTGGTAPVDPNSPYNYNSTVTVLGPGGLAKTGYTFSGWNTAANGSGTSYSPGATFSITANTTLYAQWTINTYTVTYDGNTSTGGTAPVDPNSPYNYNSTVTVLGPGSLTKTGYTFSNWNTAANGSGTSYSPGATFSITANTTLFAQWTINPATTVYVDDNWTGVPNGQDPDGPGPATAMGYDAFATIQGGVDGVASSAAFGRGGNSPAVASMVIVYAGNYTETVNVNKSVALVGPQAGVNPDDVNWNDVRSNLANEAVIQGALNLSIQNTISVDGFTLNRSASNEGHILIGGGLAGGSHTTTQLTIQNNRITGSRSTSPTWAGIHTNFLDNFPGPFTLPGANLTIHHNRIVIGGSASGDGILINRLVPGTDNNSSLSITDNYIASDPFNGSAVATTQTQTSNGVVQVTGNYLPSGEVAMFRTLGANIANNQMITPAFDGVWLNGGDNNITVTGNTITNPPLEAIVIGDFAFSTPTPRPNSNITVSNNTVTVDATLLDPSSGPTYSFFKIGGGLTGTNAINDNSLTISGALPSGITEVYGIHVHNRNIGAGSDPQTVGSVSMANNTLIGGGLLSGNSAGLKLDSNLTSSTDVTFGDGNSITGFPFGIDVARGSAHMSGSTISGSGTAVRVDASGSGTDPVTMTITNSTLSGNSATNGGAINGVGTGGIAKITITNSTLTKNSPSGASILLQDASLTVGNSIFNRAAPGTTISALGTSVVTSLGYNLSRDSFGGFLTNTGDQINTDPILGPLKNNNGPTKTHAPLSNSPAIDRGKDFGPVGPGYTATGKDQRGSTRPVTYNDPSILPPAGGDRSDIGAVELPPGVIPTDANSRKTHGAAGDFDIDLPFSGPVGVECRSGGLNKEYQIILSFTPGSSITFTSAAVNDGAGFINGSVLGSGTDTLTVNLIGVTNAQRITLALFGANNGTNSGDVGVRMGVLLGDVDASANTNSTDVSPVKLEVGNPVGIGNFREDVLANGAINSTDVSITKLQSGTGLPVLP